MIEVPVQNAWGAHLSELVEILQIAAGTRVDPEFEPVPAPAVPVRYLSAGKARQRLGWRPQHTFEEAVLLTTRWYRGHLDPPPG